MLYLPLEILALPQMNGYLSYSEPSPPFHPKGIGFGNLQLTAISKSLCRVLIPFVIRLREFVNCALVPDLAAFYGISFRLRLPKFTKFRCGSLVGQNSNLFRLCTPSDLLSQQLATTTRQQRRRKR
jgi:hypothetical protein